MNSPSNTPIRPASSNTDANRTPQRTTWLRAGWLALFSLLATSFLTVELGLNFLGWSPGGYEWHTVLAAFGYITGLLAVVRLARQSDKWTSWMAFVLLLVLCGGGIFLATETRTEGGLLQLVEAPVWYRIARSVVLFLPMVVFLVVTLSGRRSQSSPDDSTRSPRPDPPQLSSDRERA